MIGRACEIMLAREIPETEFVEGMDYRRLDLRRGLFKRIYEFHSRFRSHPGGVYYLLPYLKNAKRMTVEQALWFGFINGCCQHPPTTYFIWSHFPDFEKVKLDKLREWFYANYEKMGWDTDRRYVKNKFMECVKSYRDNVIMHGGSQQSLFESILYDACAKENFRLLWNYVMTNFAFFGRLSTFSYLEYLKILGLNIECDGLFLRDLNGSKSHRNGLCKVLGRDDLDWHESNPEFKGYTPPIIEWLEEEGKILLGECLESFEKNPSGWRLKPDYFTMESALCLFKSCFRPNRRYPNVYSDMLYLRLKNAECLTREDYGLFWQARESALDPILRMESDPSRHRTSLDRHLQNQFRLTGSMPIIGHYWPCFQGPFQNT